MQMWALKQKTSSGFTIVELLIVVVVIAILAAITIISYNGIQNRAKVSAAQSISSQAAKKLATLAITNNDTFPADENAFLLATNLSESNGTTYEYSSPSPNLSYCLTATTNSLSYFTTNTSQNPVAGACPGHGANGVPAITNYALNPSFETNNSSWGRSGASAVTLNNSRSTARSHDGVASLLQEITGTGQTGLAISTPSSGDRLRVNAGESASWSFWMYSTKAGTITPYCDGALVAGGYAGLSGAPSVAIPADTWTKVIGYGTRGVGAGDMYVTQCGGYNIATAPGDQLWFDEFMVTKGLTQQVFANGSSTNWIWNGTINNSTSTGPPL